MLKKDRGREVSRLEAFSDAVFAFSATLLVVSLEVPDTYAHGVFSEKQKRALRLEHGEVNVVH